MTENNGNNLPSHPQQPPAQPPVPPEQYGQSGPYAQQPPQAPYAQQPFYPQQPPPAQYAQQPPQYAQQQVPYGQPVVFAPAPPPVPGKTMGIVALILPFVGFCLVGLVLGIIALVQSKKAGFKNTPALIAVIVSAVFIVLEIVAAIFIITAIANGANSVSTQIQIINQCDSATSNGYYTLNGQNIACPAPSP